MRKPPAIAHTQRCALRPARRAIRIVAHETSVWKEQFVPTASSTGLCSYLAPLLQKLVQVDDAEGAQWRTSREASVVDRLGCRNGART